MTTSEDERSFGRQIHRVEKTPRQRMVAQNHGQQCERVAVAWQQVLEQYGEAWVEDNLNQAAETTLKILGDEWSGWGRRQVLHAVGAVPRPKAQVAYPMSNHGVDSSILF